MLQLLAPAKLNLFLRITSRRKDGYHELQTLFQLINHGDELGFELREDSTIALSVKAGTNNPDPDASATDPEPCVPAEPSVSPTYLSKQLLDKQPGQLLGKPENNLVMLAAKSLQAHSACTQGADIKLTKCLPIGGGLGGGSSDAATTLLGLNKLWQLNYSLDDLAQIGLKLGADVPVFVYGHTAWAEGIGERLSPLDTPSLWYVVITPGCSVSTSEIFNHQQLTRNSPPITIRAFREHGAGNDCQKVVEKCYPEVKTARLWLGQYAPAQLTGTGACIFASFADKAQATAVLAEKPAHWQGFVAQGLNQSPVRY